MTDISRAEAQAMLIDMLEWYSIDPSMVAAEGLTSTHYLSFLRMADGRLHIDSDRLARVECPWPPGVDVEMILHLWRVALPQESS